jgi:hypothetical protein
MKPQLSRIENYPQVAAKLDQHIRETGGQISRIEEVLSGLNEDHSSLKDMALSFSGAMAAMGHMMAGDEILKNSFANFAFENFEMAAYNSLLTVAEAGGYGAGGQPRRGESNGAVARRKYRIRHHKVPVAERIGREGKDLRYNDERRRSIVLERLASSSKTAEYRSDVTPLGKKKRWNREISSVSSSRPCRTDFAMRRMLYLAICSRHFW